MKKNDILFLLAGGVGLYILSKNKVAQAENDAALARAIIPPAAPRPEYLDRTTVDEYIAGYEFAPPAAPSEWDSIFG